MHDAAYSEVKETYLLYGVVVNYNLAACHQREGQGKDCDERLQLSVDALKELLKIKVTNVPESQDYIKEGNTIMSCDGNQYIINYEGEKFIKIDEVYIVGVYGEELT